MHMQKLFVALFVTLTMAAIANSQTTSVTGTATDSQTTPYIGGTWTATLKNTSTSPPIWQGTSSFQTSYGGSLDTTGSLAVTLPSNTGTGAITVGGLKTTQWQFNICARDGGTCFVAAVTITGTSQSISTQLTNSSRITFVDGEPNQPPCGSNQVIVSLGATSWGCVATSAINVPGGSNTQVQFNDAGIFAGSSKLTLDKTTGALTSTSTSAALTSITSGTSQGNGLQVVGNSGVNVKAEEAGGQLFMYTTSGDINLNPGAGKDVVVGGPSQSNSGAFKFVGTTSGLARVGVADVAGTPNRINIPTSTGAVGAFLQTNGGNPQQTSWSSPWFDVKAYGATGDGVTDDSAAINAAITAAKAGGGGIVFLDGPSTYAVGSTVNLTAGHVELLGSGERSTVLKWIGAANGTVLSTSSLAYSRVRGFQVDCNSTAGIGIDATAINASGVSIQNVFDQLDVRNCLGTPGYDIHVGSSTNQQVSETLFHEILLGPAATNGIYQEGTQTINIAYDGIAGGPGNGANGINIRNGSATVLHYSAGDSSVALRLAIAVLVINVQYAEWEGMGNNLSFLLMEDGAGNGNAGPLVTLKDSRIAWSLAGATNVIQYGVTTGSGGHLTLSGNKFDAFAGTPQVYVQAPAGINTYFTEFDNTYLSTPVVTSGSVQRLYANSFPDSATGLGFISSYPLAINQNSIVAATAPPIAKFTTTWNNASLVGEGIQLNVTNSSSAVGSLLLDLQVGAVPKFGVDKNGLTVFNGGAVTSSAPPSVASSTAGWKYCLFGITFCTATDGANRSEYHLLQGTNGWFSIGKSSTLSGDATGSRPDTSAGLSIWSNGFLLIGKESANANCGTQTNIAGSSEICADPTSHEFLAATNGSTSLGMLRRTQPLPINSSDLTAAVSTATLCAAAAGACNQPGQYALTFDFIETGTACATPGTGGVTFLLTWTDANGTAHSAVSLGMDDASALNVVSQTFHFQTSLGAAFASGQFVFSSNGSVVQYATGYTACSVGTGTYRVQASVARLQ